MKNTEQKRQRGWNDHRGMSPVITVAPPTQTWRIRTACKRSQPSFENRKLRPRRTVWGAFSRHQRAATGSDFSKISMAASDGTTKPV